jgi:hypothetical protein
MLLALVVCPRQLVVDWDASARSCAGATEVRRSGKTDPTPPHLDIAPPLLGSGNELASGSVAMSRSRLDSVSMGGSAAVEAVLQAFRQRSGR